MHRYAISPTVVLVGGLILIIVGGSIDLIMDRPAHWLTFHVLFELMLIAGAIVTMTALWLGVQRARVQLHQLAATLGERRSAIEQQFMEWQLTPTEREVAFGLLQGYSHKRIARDAGRSERTVRQHATAVYEKAGVASRAELAAFFLVALRLPRADRA